MCKYHSYLHVCLSTYVPARTINDIKCLTSKRPRPSKSCHRPTSAVVMNKSPAHVIPNDVQPGTYFKSGRERKKTKERMCSLQPTLVIYRSNQVSFPPSFPSVVSLASTWHCICMYDWLSFVACVAPIISASQLWDFPGIFQIAISPPQNCCAVRRSSRYVHVSTTRTQVHMSVHAYAHLCAR